MLTYVFYNAFFLIGILAFYRFFAHYFPQRKNTILVFLICLPSIWFWCSGVHKDGFVVTFLGLSLYYLLRYCQRKKIRYGISFLFFVLATALIRYYLIVFLLPFLGMYLLSLYKEKHAVKIFVFGSLLFVILFFNFQVFFPNIYPAQFILLKQASFNSLHGGSFITAPKLEPNWLSFAKNIPVALNHCMMRPYIWEAKDAAYICSALETVFIFISLVGLLLSNKIKNYRQSLFLFALFFSTVMFIIIGYIVPFSGAFVRYRSEYFPLLFGVLIGGSSLVFLDKIEMFLAKGLEKKASSLIH
jgi:hypothetical protein